ncbi:hypothetical protein TCAL_15341 [Tigriopus californicus]|uniref:Uncharacterized protein n=1 Tax=Tigriopus californicus TaxID=6832 RepID=A0A553PJ86_TIGCA|nr:hypothetical protein TCAL_15341 [Tigriopus californicus]
MNNTRASADCFFTAKLGPRESEEEVEPSTVSFSAALASQSVSSSEESSLRGMMIFLSSWDGERRKARFFIDSNAFCLMLSKLESSSLSCSRGSWSRPTFCRCKSFRTLMVKPDCRASLFNDVPNFRCPKWYLRSKSPKGAARGGGLGRGGEGG